MAKQERVEHLISTIEDAMVRAEKLGLTFAVYILGIARLEVDQSQLDSPEFMGTTTIRQLGKPS